MSVKQILIDFSELSDDHIPIGADVCGPTGATARSTCMKLLLDQNLSRKLVHKLNPLFPDSQHVLDVELDKAADRSSSTI